MVATASPSVADIQERSPCEKEVKGVSIISWLKNKSRQQAQIDDYTGGTKEMNLVARLKSRLSSAYRAKWHYRRGMMRAKVQKHQAAIDDYTVVIDKADAPGNLRAMALYNRALVYHAEGSESHAIGDLNQVIGMAEAAERVKTEARRQLVRMKRKHDRDAGSPAE